MFDFCTGCYGLEPVPADQLHEAVVPVGPGQQRVFEAKPRRADGLRCGIFFWWQPGVRGAHKSEVSVTERASKGSAAAPGTRRRLWVYRPFQRALGSQ